jgi:hypothetical protein
LQGPPPKKKALVVESSSPDEEDIIGQPTFNDDGSITWSNKNYQGLWDKMNNRLQNALLSDREWLQEFMNNCVKARLKSSPCQFTNPSNLIIPPQILDDVKSTISTLGQTHNKKVIIAETSYPFTLGFNDWTHNVLGTTNQIIPSYDATPLGQKNYLLALKEKIKEAPQGFGFCYWGTEWVAFRGNQSTNGSPWENQSLWDFNNRALPAMEVFGE